VPKAKAPSMGGGFKGKSLQIDVEQINAETED
jgi:hypothetical protein